MGQADPELQLKLIRNYLGILESTEAIPSSICFYGEGVRLVTEGSSVLGELQALEKRGAQLIVCTTCLNYFELTDKVRVGNIATMKDIVEAQWQADKVITL
jgi:intracellular sulfur oxidation DsrE/DsrF family protein